MSPLREEQDQMTAQLAELEERFDELVMNAGRSSSEFPPPTERRPQPTLLEQCPKNLVEAFAFLARCKELFSADDPALVELAAHVRAAGYVELARLDSSVAFSLESQSLVRRA
jgi:hypothetical protein